MCDSMPLLDESIFGEEFKRQISSSNQYLNSFSNILDPPTTSHNKAADNIFSIRSQSGAHLAKRIAQTDELVRQLRNTEDERNEAQRKLEDLLKSVNGVQSLYDNEKRQRLDFQRKFEELTLKCENQNTNLINNRLKIDQMEAQLDSFKGPIDYRELIVRHLNLFQRIAEDSSMHWHDQLLVKELTSYCEKNKIKILPVSARSPRKRKSQVNKKDFGVQCNTIPEHNEEKAILINQSTQCEKVEMHDKACQHIVITTKRGTSTADLIKHRNIGTNYNLADTNPSVDKILEEINNSFGDVMPISPIIDLEEKTNNIRISMKNTPIPLQHFDLKSICNPLSNIKISNSRPPSSLMYSDIKNESNSRFSTSSPQTTMKINNQILSNTSEELWNIFHMLYGYLCSRIIDDVKSGTSSSTTYNRFHSFLENMHMNEKRCNEDVQKNEMQDNLLDHHIHQPSIISPQVFTNTVPLYTEKCISTAEDNYLVKPKAQRNDDKETFLEKDILTKKQTDRNSIGTSPIRCIKSLSSSSLNENSLPFTTSMAGPSNLYKQNSNDLNEMSSAFAVIDNQKDKLDKIPLKSSSVKIIAEQILQLFPSVEDRNEKLKSIKKLLNKNCRKGKKRKIKPDIELDGITAVDFIAQLKGFENKNINETIQENKREENTKNEKKPSKTEKETSCSLLRQNKTELNSPTFKTPLQMEKQMLSEVNNCDYEGVNCMRQLTETDANQVCCEKNKEIVCESRINLNMSPQRTSEEIIKSDDKLTKSNETKISIEDISFDEQTNAHDFIDEKRMCSGTFGMPSEISTDIPLKTLECFSLISKNETSENIDAFASICSDEPSLVITSDPEDISEIVEIRSPPKKRGCKRKSESIFSVSENSTSKLPTVEINNEFATISSYKPLLDIKTVSEDISENLESKPTPKKPGRKRKRDLLSLSLSPPPVPATNLPLISCKRSARLLAKEVAKHQITEIKEFPESIQSLNTENIIKNIAEENFKDEKSKFKQATVDDKLNEIFSTSSLASNSSSVYCIASPPASPTRDIESNFSSTVIIPLDIKTPLTKKKTYNKSTIFSLINAYDVGTHRPFNSKFVTFSETESAQLQQFRSLFINFFASHEIEPRIKAKNVVSTLLQTEEHLKLIPHALIATMQDAPRTSPEPYPAYNSNISNVISEMNPHLSTIWHQSVPFILEHLNHMQPELVAILPNLIEATLFDERTSTMSMSLSAVLNLTDFYLIILLNNYIPMTPNPARLFIAKCLYFHQKKSPPMIYSVLNAFPSVIPHREEHSYDRSDVLITVIQHLLMCTPYDMNNHDYLHRELLSKLRFTYHFEIFKPTFEDVLNNLLEKLRAGKLQDLSYAFAIFCKREKYERILNQVLQAHLIPLSQEYYGLLQQTTDYDLRAGALLDCISSVVKPFSSKKFGRIDITEYLNLFKRYLLVVERPSVQEAAINAILRLQHMNYNVCFYTLLAFKPEYKIQTQTYAALKTFLHRKPLHVLKALLSKNKGK